MSQETRTVQITNFGGFPIHELAIHHFQYHGSNSRENRYNEQTVLFSAKNNAGQYLSAPTGDYALKNVVIKELDAKDFAHAGQIVQFEQSVDPDHKSHWNVAWRCANDTGIYYLTQNAGFWRKFVGKILQDVLDGIDDAIDFFTESDLGTELGEEFNSSVLKFVSAIDKQLDKDSDTIEHKFHGDSSCRQDIHIGDSEDSHIVNRDQSNFNSAGKKVECTVHNFGFPNR